MSDTRKQVQSSQEYKDTSRIDPQKDILKQAETLGKQIPTHQPNTPHTMLERIMDTVHNVESVASNMIYDLAGKILVKGKKTTEEAHGSDVELDEDESPSTSGQESKHEPNTEATKDPYIFHKHF